MRNVVAALLYLFPARFRREFGNDMLATFNERWREQPGVRTAMRTVLDLARSAAQEHLCHPSASSVRPEGDKLVSIFLQDLRYALRTLLRSRGFTAVALVTLALGIGLNTAMFSIANAVLWRSLPFPHAEQLVQVGEVDAHDRSSYWGASYPNLEDWRARSTSFEYLAGVMRDDHILREGAEPVHIFGLAVSHEFFPALGVAAAMGRVFTEAEDRKGTAPVIVISHQMWTRRLASDPAVLGRAIRFGDTAYTVIGVMPAGFEYRRAEYWTLLGQVIEPHFQTHRNVWVLDTVARLRAGKTPADAQREVEAIAAQIRRDHPEVRRDQVVSVTLLSTQLSHDLRPALLVLLGAVGFVLLIVCGNLAGLMLVRGTGRAREMAIRTALGVGGSRLIRQLLTESALLAGAGGVLGIGLAWWATRSISLLTKDPRLLDVPIDATVLGFAAAVTAGTTVLFGVAPAIRATRVDASEALKSGARAGGSRERGRAQRFLVVAEVALCLTLLAGAGLLVKSFRRVLEVNPGFRSEGLVSMRIALPLRYSTATAVSVFYRQLVDRLKAIPGVSDATIASALPISGGDPNGDISIAGRPSSAGELGAASFRRVMPNYFELLGIPLVRGRWFDERDDGSRGRPVIINANFARHFWPNSDAIGQVIRIGPQDSNAWLTIVGVVGDVKQSGLEMNSPFSVYEPLATGASGRFEVAVRTAGEPDNLLAPVRKELRALEPGLLVENLETMSQRITGNIAPRRLNLLLFGLFAVLALLLSAVGLYGVVAYAARQRTQEFGIRMALGAQPGDVLRLVLGEGLKLVLAGVCIGLIATLSLAHLMTGLLFGVAPTDPATLAAVAMLLAVVALSACWLPAQRATRIGPVDALRSE